jgi:ribosomal-protein-alanine N-acetyltransferase
MRAQEMSALDLLFEPLDESHADALYPEFSEISSFRYTAGRVPASVEALRQEFSELRAGPAPDRNETWMNWAVREPATARLVGALQATVFADGTLWIGYRIIRTASGQGIATAAVQWLLRELAARYPGRAAWAAVDTRNAPSLRVMEKCSFAYVRTEPAEIRGEATFDHIFEYIL